MAVNKRYILYFIALIAALMLLIYTSEHPWLRDLAMVITAMMLVAKNKVISVLLMSKVKFLLFVKTMTTVKLVTLAIKRFIIDNVVSKWMGEHIVNPVMEPVKESFRYFRQFSWRRKLKNLALFILPVTVVVWLGSFGELFSQLFFIAEIKAIVIGFFKLLWIVLAKIIVAVIYFFQNVVANSFLSPVFEVFAISVILSLIERLPIIGKPLRKFFEYLGSKITALFHRFDRLHESFVTPYLEKYVGSNVVRVTSRWSDKIKQSKIKNEKELIENFVHEVADKTILHYYSHKKLLEMSKQEAVDLINEKTGDNINIVAWFSVDYWGNILQDDRRDSLENDIFLIESLASCAKHGVSDPDHEITQFDFWVYNSSEYPFCLHHKEAHFQSLFLAPKSVQFVKSEESIDYKNGDIVLEHCDDSKNESSVNI